MSYYMRWALPWTTVAFALFTLSTTGRRWLRVALVSAMFIGYYLVMYGGRAMVLAGTLPAYVAAWFPNVAIASVGIASLAFHLYRRDISSTVSG
jgi:lipopolysaccharide export LptBFGC system permease protein LptF